MKSGKLLKMVVLMMGMGLGLLVACDGDASSSDHAFKTKFDQIKVGMKVEEVKTILGGEPDKSELLTSYTLTWFVGDLAYMVTFSNDHVVQHAGSLPGPGGT